MSLQRNELPDPYGLSDDPCQLRLPFVLIPHQAEPMMQAPRIRS
jgi:hypothetical protein